ncbi:MAG: DNA polymerase III subunit gamma/tau [Holosporales bacterium]
MYRALARKYRPQHFDDLVGQDVVVRTFRNAFAQNRIAQAYMFTGVRGVGKTTTARIIAKALNCVGADGTLTRPTIMPCGVCPQCVAITDDRHLDVLEIDAASHTGVEAMREDILAQVRYTPTQGRRKVYIIDEVHMLSTAAFNALLKTLEEPPAHVTFLFATTDIHKVPVTVLSRCQRFDLARLSPAALAEHLTLIAGKEGATLDSDAAAALARAAEGSVRDGLSLLDQALALAGEGGQVTGALAFEMLGRGDALAAYDLLHHALAGRVAPCLEQLETLYRHGVEPLLLLKDMLSAVHAASRARVAPNLADHSGLPEGERQAIASLAAAYTVPILTRAWQIVLHGYEEIRLAENSLQAAEMILIRLCYVGNLPTPEELLKAPVPTATTAAPGVAPIKSPAAPPVPTQFAELITLAEAQREGNLAYHLRHSVAVQKFAPPLLEIALLSGASPTLPGQLAQFLLNHTGTRWVVTVAENTGAVSLAAASANERKAAEQWVLADPLVVEALRLFPGASVMGVTPREMGEGSNGRRLPSIARGGIMHEK